MHPKDAAGIANSVDPDQTAPLGAVWSGSAVCSDLSVRKLRIITVSLVSSEISSLYLVSEAEKAGLSLSRKPQDRFSRDEAYIA